MVGTTGAGGRTDGAPFEFATFSLRENLHMPPLADERASGRLLTRPIRSLVHLLHPLLAYALATVSGIYLTS